MKALTVRHPWSWAIVHGGKTVENRTRNLAGKYRGPLAIHTSQTLDGDAIYDPTIMAAYPATVGDAHREFVADRRGTIVGVVDLVDVHPAEQVGSSVSVWADWCCLPWGQRDAVHLVLANPRPIEPIACRGQLGLWNTPEHVTAWIEDQLRSERVQAEHDPEETTD